MGCLRLLTCAHLVSSVLQAMAYHSRVAVLLSCTFVLTVLAQDQDVNDDQWAMIHEFQTKQFKVMDENDDGTVTSEELTEVVRKLKARAIKTGVDMHAKKDDGQPAPWKGFEDFESALVQKADINEKSGEGPAGWFKEHADKNADG